MRFKVEVLRHHNDVYLVEADDAQEAGDMVQERLNKVTPLNAPSLVTSIKYDTGNHAEVLRSGEVDAEVIGVYDEDEETQPSGGPC